MPNTPHGDGSDLPRSSKPYRKPYGGSPDQHRSSHKSSHVRNRKDKDTYGQSKREKYRDNEKEPILDDSIHSSDLAPELRRDLRSLDKRNAETVARHLVAVGEFLPTDPERALAHAQAAKARAARIGIVREIAGVAAYSHGQWSQALTDLKAAHRMSGSHAVLPLIADCERGLQRPKKAIELAESAYDSQLSEETEIELRIVESGAWRDLGEYDKAVVTLQVPQLSSATPGGLSARLFYAYAEALLADNRTEDAIKWFSHAASSDIEEVTDAEERWYALQAAARDNDS